MVAFNKFEDFIFRLGQGVHDMTATGDQLEVYLSNAAPSVSADTVKADVAEITIQNGYTGPEDTANGYTETTGTGTVTGTDVVINATGTVGPFQYVIYQNTTPAAPLDPLIGWWDHGTPVTLANGESFTVDFGASVLTLGP